MTLYKCQCPFVLPFESFTFMDVVILVFYTVLLVFFKFLIVLINLGSVYTTMAISVERYTTITNSCWKVGTRIQVWIRNR